MGKTNNEVLTFAKKKHVIIHTPNTSKPSSPILSAVGKNVASASIFTSCVKI